MSGGARGAIRALASDRCYSRGGAGASCANRAVVKLDKSDPKRSKQTAAAADVCVCEKFKSKPSLGI